MQPVSTVDALQLIEALGEAAFSDGIVNVIDLSQIRDRLGERWAQRREQVGEHLVKAFRKRTRASDTILRIDEGKYLAIQPGATRAIAMASCGAAALETITYFLGAAEHPQIALHCLIGVIDGRLNVAPIDEKTVLGAMQTAERPVNDAQATPFGQPMWEALDKNFDRRGRVVVQTGPRIEAHFQLDPVWNARQSAVVAFVVNPIAFADEPGGIDLLRLTDLKTTPALTLTLAMIDFAAAALKAGREAGRPFGIHLPISIEVVTPSRTRLALTQRLKQLKPEDRQMLVLEIADCPARAPQSRITEMVTVLQPFCRAVVARVEGGLAPPKSWAASGLAGLAIQFDGSEALTERGAMARLAEFSEAAKSYRIVLGHGMRRRGLVLTAWAHGFTHISGQIISDEMQADPRLRRMSIGDIFAPEPARPKSAAAEPAPA